VGERPLTTSIHSATLFHPLLGGVAAVLGSRGAVEVGGIGVVRVAAGGPAGTKVPFAVGVAVVGSGALGVGSPVHGGIAGAHDFHDADNGTPGGTDRIRGLLVADGSAAVPARLIGRGGVPVALLC